MCFLTIFAHKGRALIVGSKRETDSLQLTMVIGPDLAAIVSQLRRAPGGHRIWSSMYRSTTIANYFLRKGWEEGNPLTSMQVLKLMYIAYGWVFGRGG